MKKIFSFLFIFVLFFGLISCTETNESENENGGNTQTTKLLCNFM